MPRVVVRVDDELVVAKRAILRPDGRIGIRRPLHEADAVLIVHEGEETLVVGLRRKAVGRLHDLHARPVDLVRRAARDLEQCVADRLVHKVEIRLAEVFHAAHGDILSLDVQRVVRHDIARSSAIAAVQKYAAHREIVCSERDRISRRRARAAGTAAVDVHARAERAARDRDGVARRLACGHGIVRNVRICRELPAASRRSAAMDLGAVAERTVRDRDLVIRRIARSLGIAAVDCRIVPNRAARDIDFVRLHVACRHEMRLMQRILCDIAARDLSICADRAAREVELVALHLGVRTRIHRDRMRLVDRRAREEVLPLRPAAVCLPDRAARDRERIVLRAAVLRNRIARARRRMRARRDGELVVLRRIAVDGDARIRALRGGLVKLRRLRRQRLRRILIAKPQQAELRRCNDPRGILDARAIGIGGRGLAILVVAVVVKKRRRVAPDRHCGRKIEIEDGALFPQRNLMVEPRLIVLDDKLIPIKTLQRIVAHVEHVVRHQMGVRPDAVRGIQAVVEDELHRLKAVDARNTIIFRCDLQHIIAAPIRRIVAAVYLDVAERLRIVEHDAIPMRRAAARRIAGVDRSAVGQSAIRIGVGLVGSCVDHISDDDGVAVRISISRIAAVEERRIAGPCRMRRVRNQRRKRIPAVDRQRVAIHIPRAQRPARIDIQNARHRRRRGRLNRQAVAGDIPNISRRGVAGRHGKMRRLSRRRIGRVRTRHGRMRGIDRDALPRHRRGIHRQKRGKRIPSGQQKNRHIAR